MKINNYIKVLSAVLIVFGFSNNGYSAPAQVITAVPTSQPVLVQGMKPTVQNTVNQVQQPVQNNAYSGVVQGTQTRDDVIINSDDSNADQAFLQKQNEEKKELLIKYCDITAMMHKAFHSNKHKTQNAKLKKYIEDIFLEFQFIYPACNAECAKQYSDAVKDLKKQLEKYNDGCQDLIETYAVSNKVEKWYYSTRYNVQELEKLRKSIDNFSAALDKSISTLYPNIATQPVQNAVNQTQQLVQATAYTNVVQEMKHAVKNVVTQPQQPVQAKAYTNLGQGMKPEVQNVVTQVQQPVQTVVGQA